MNRLVSLAITGTLAAAFGFAQEPATTTPVTPAPPAASATADAATTKNRIGTRKDRQQKRIAEGVQSGELTAAETARIEKREAKLNKQIREDRKDGSGLTAKEKVKIEKRQDRISRSIAKQKHDKQDQNK